MAGTAHEETVWKTHVHTRPAKAGDEERWFQIQDLIVDEIQSQMVFLGETYLQVRERLGEDIACWPTRPAR